MAWLRKQECGQQEIKPTVGKQKYPENTKVKVKENQQVVVNLGERQKESQSLQPQTTQEPKILFKKNLMAQTRWSHQGAHVQ